MKHKKVWSYACVGVEFCVSAQNSTLSNAQLWPKDVKFAPMHTAMLWAMPADENQNH